ncbi:helix-turn-helix transcriptional regulator, partial [Streptomyces sp. NPDC005271]|uniref:helix-turn-helix domain-containing protein n=1 Tax=unclassified Streptomyces TaxID=2593676 RepID=UPI0033AA8B79
MPQSNEEHTGARIARTRRERGLTQQGLAMRANVSKSLLSKVECGQRPASPSLIAACARALSLDPPTWFRSALWAGSGLSAGVRAWGIHWSS